MPDNVDFWAMLIGIIGTATLLGGLYLLIELRELRQHARYRRAQQDRVNRRSGVFHNGEAN